MRAVFGIDFPEISAGDHQVGILLSVSRVVDYKFSDYEEE